MKKLCRLLIFGMTFLATSRAFPCGGPASYNSVLYSSLAPLDMMLEQIITPTDDFGDGFTLPSFLFLYPFHADPAHRAQVEDLWNYSYSNQFAFEEENAPTPTAPPAATDLQPFQAAIQSGDAARAEGEAKKIVNQVLDMPAAQANDNQKNFARALEYLDLAPVAKTLSPERLAAFFLPPDTAESLWPLPPRRAWDMMTLPLALQQAWIVRLAERKDYGDLAQRFPQSPRAALLRFVALQEKFHNEIPNGWIEEIQKKMTPAAWKGLEQACEAWLKDFPQHPLADLARMTQLRAVYFQNDTARAWNLLLTIYPRHLPRVLGEMRFLLQRDLPPKTLPGENADPLLQSALLTSVPVTAAEWNTLWQSAQKNLPAAWAVNLQERLLRSAVDLFSREKDLPAAFPANPDNPSPLWGKLRLLALLRANRLDAALAQAKSLKSDAQADSLRARLYLAKHDFAQVLALPQLPPEVKQYLVRVLYDAPTLTSLCSQGEAKWRGEACLRLASEQLKDGAWTEGANLLQTTQGARAELWRQAAKLSADSSPAGLLNWARFLRGHVGKVFFPADTTWYRTLNFRQMNLQDDMKAAQAPPTQMPWSASEENTAIQNYFLDTSELFLAVKAYAAWLKGADPKDKTAAKVLQEADKTYNDLINWDNYNSPFWQNYLEKSEWAAAIREAGKAIRSKS